MLLKFLMYLFEILKQDWNSYDPEEVLDPRPL